MEHKDIQNYIFDFAFNQALGDATRRTDAASCKEAVLKSSENDSKPGVKELVRDYFDAIIEGKNHNFYKTAEEVVNCKVKNFTFGNAQKLINMTVKYMYAACYKDEELRKRFETSHCPMDSRMKDKVVKQYKKVIKDNDELSSALYYQQTDKNKKEVIKSKDWSKVSWSKIEQEDVRNYPSSNPYSRYQQMVCYLAKKIGISPLEYDFKEFEFYLDESKDSN